MNVSALEAQGLSRWYGDVIAVNNLTVEMQPGIVGLLGPNGAGKSTLMRLAMGLLKPSSGRIEVLGQNPWNNQRLLKRIGYVGEGDAPWRDRTARDAAILAGRLTGLSQAQANEAADRALEDVGLSDQAGKRVDAYSRGMRQRLKFALALLHDPELFILDEPLLGTDPLTRRDLIHLIQRLARDNRSVLVSTHILPDVEAMTQRILLMANGRLMAYGDVSDIRDLLEQYPRTVRIATSDPRAVGARLWGWPTVLSLQAEENAVVVKTPKPKEFFAELQKILVEENLPFTSITSPDDNVEAVFRYLVG
jgi:ABC-2 type transport system ATP-binding protein